MSKRRTGSARDRQRSEDVSCSRGRSRRWWSWKGQAKLTIGRYVRTAHASLKEHQLAEYVARLEIEECARILAAAPEGLLAARRDEVRVGAGERRSFEEVIRTPTELVLSGVEGG